MAPKAAAELLQTWHPTTPATSKRKSQVSPPSPPSATKPPTSSALAYIPAAVPMPLDPVVARPEPLRPIEPWNLTSPIPLTDTCPIFYNAVTQEYFLFTAEGALLIHKTEKITIPKKIARRFLHTWPEGNAHAAVSSALGRKVSVGLKSSSPLLTDKVVVYHAVHDSIVVKRRSGNTGLFRFCVDKALRLKDTPEFLVKDVYTKFVRPEFGCVLSCQCEKVVYYGKTVYCPACTSYRTALCMNLNNLTPKAPQVLGKITMPIPIAQTIFSQCLDPETGKVSIDRAHETLSKCFNMTDPSRIPIQPGDLVANLLRDCLFVATEDGQSASASSSGSFEKQQRKVRRMSKGPQQLQKVSWATFFDIAETDIPRSQASSQQHGHGHASTHNISISRNGSVTGPGANPIIAAA
ncbi:hypothetical protein BJX70DRAFT_397015 [Aspergillus crustosus]